MVTQHQRERHLDRPFSPTAGTEEALFLKKNRDGIARLGGSGKPRETLDRLVALETLANSYSGPARLAAVASRGETLDRLAAPETLANSYSGPRSTSRRRSSATLTPTSRPRTPQLLADTLARVLVPEPHR